MSKDWVLRILVAASMSPLFGCSKTPECSADAECQGARVCDAQLRICVDRVSPPDLRMSTPPDLLAPAPDLAREDRCPGGMTYKFATSRVQLPGAMASYALDLDGDGRRDNQFKAIVSALSAANFDLDAPLAAAVADGSLLSLLALRAPDLNMGCAALALNLGEKPAVRPRYDGNDRFTINRAQPPADLEGLITAGQFSSTLPSDLRPGQVPVFTLNLPFGSAVLPLRLYGVHVQGKVAQSGITTGEIHGVIRKQDIDGQIIPAIALNLTEVINKNPNASSTETIVRLFEDPANNPASKAKCDANPKDCCQKLANRPTCKITADEVRTNALIDNVLAVDVQMFEGDTWKPVPRGPNKDAMSFGIGFESVKAQF